MKTERIIVSFFAIIVGLTAAGGAFYFYQKNANAPQSKTLSSLVSPAPTPDITHLLTVISPTDGLVTNNKTITLTGTATNNSTVLISTENDDQIVKASTSGNFTAQVSLPSGTSVIRITAIFPGGEEKHVSQTITSSTEL